MARDLALLKAGLRELAAAADGRAPAYVALEVEGTELADLEGLAKYPKLQRLRVAGNAIASLQGLRHLANVATLDASGNKVAGTLKALATDGEGHASPEAAALPTSLKSVVVADNLLTAVTPLVSMHRLRHLDVSGNAIKCLDGCLQAPYLETLKATNCKLVTCISSHDAVHDLAGVPKWVSSIDVSNNLLTSLDDLLEVFAPARQFHAVVDAVELALRAAHIVEHTAPKLGRASAVSLKRDNVESAEGAPTKSGSALRLRVLKAAHNRIPGLESSDRRFRRVDGLYELDLSHNLISTLEECVCLHNITALRHLALAGNPCCKCIDYRLHILFICTQIITLDGMPATAAQKVHAVNLYGADAKAEASIRQGFFALELSDYGRAKPARSAALPVAENALDGTEGGAEAMARADAHAAGLVAADTAAAAATGGAAALADTIAGAFPNQVEALRACYMWVATRLNRELIIHGDCTIRDTELGLFLPEYVAEEEALMRARIPAGRAQNIVPGKAPEGPDNPEGTMPTTGGPFAGMYCERASYALMALLHHRGMECRIVSGFTKADHSWVPGKSLIVPNGCWLGVKAEGKWRLVDIACSDPEIPQDSFFLPPAELIFSRFPLEQQMQLLGAAPLSESDGEPGTGPRDVGKLALPRPSATVRHVIHTGNEPEADPERSVRQSTMGPTMMLDHDDFWTRPVVYPSFFTAKMSLVGHDGMLLGDMMRVFEDSVSTVTVQFDEQVFGLHMHVYDINHAVHSGLDSHDESMELHEPSRWGIANGAFEPSASWIHAQTESALDGQAGPYVYDLMVATHKPEMLVVRLTGRWGGRSHDVILLEYLLLVESDPHKSARILEDALPQSSKPTVGEGEEHLQIEPAIVMQAAAIDEAIPTAAETEEPAEEAPAPAAETEEPAEEAPAPAAETEEPAEEAPAPAAETEEPAEEAPAPAAKTEEPAEEAASGPAQPAIAAQEAPAPAAETEEAESRPSPTRTGRIGEDPEMARKGTRDLSNTDPVEHSAAYDLEAKGLPKIHRPPSFPRLSQLLRSCDIRIASPLTGELEAAKTFHFDIMLPTATRAHLRMKSEVFHLDPPEPARGKLSFTLDLVCPGKEADCDVLPPLVLWADISGEGAPAQPVATWHVEPAIETYILEDDEVLVGPTADAIAADAVLQKIKATFDASDRNKDGEVDHKELLLALRKNPDVAELLSLPSRVKASDGTLLAFDEAFVAMDKDASGTISWGEFAAALGY